MPTPSLPHICTKHSAPLRIFFLVISPLRYNLLINKCQFSDVYPTWILLTRSMAVFTRKQIRNCNEELLLRYLNYQVYTRERRLHRVCGLAFQSGEKKRGLCFYMLTDISFSIRKYAVYRRKWLEGHVALPPPPQIII